MLKMYTAIKVEDSNELFKDTHLTLSFSDVKEIDKLFLSEIEKLFPSYGLITGIEFFEKANVIVARVESVSIMAAHDYCNSIGLTYDMDFKPHITLLRTNEIEKIKDFEYLIGKEIKFNKAYFKIKNYQ